ncbi:MAG: PKD domain-containing protein [Thermoplasmatales archaeon]|nr:PKD domain-containing protein [Thermoplasmatales archaeon]MCK5260551.1 PKD domain-containing protein [Thermoplasmatales archaeon]
MKIGKILILVMIVGSLLGVSIYSVGAVEENETITDGVGDVIDFLTQEVVEEHPEIDEKNIDITMLEYKREGKRATLTLTVDGIIEDRGNISDVSDFGFVEPSFDDVNTVAYTFTLITSVESYQITYANTTCQLIYFTDFEIINLTEDDFSVLYDTLTISFDLKTDNETYEEVSVRTIYQKFSFSDWEEWDEEDLEGLEDLIIFLTDEAPNSPIQADAFAPNLGEVGKSVEFEGFPSFGQPPYTYQWEFDDGSAPSSEKSPTHIYDEPGEYEYTFTVTDNSGASASYSDTIEISGDAGDDEGIPIIMFVVVIVIIASIGIIALVYIIRR